MEFFGYAPALLSNIRLGCRYLAAANALAYYSLVFNPTLKTIYRKCPEFFYAVSLDRDDITDFFRIFFKVGVDLINHFRVNLLTLFVS